MNAATKEQIISYLEEIEAHCGSGEVEYKIIQNWDKLTSEQQDKYNRITQDYLNECELDNAMILADLEMQEEEDARNMTEHEKEFYERGMLKAFKRTLDALENKPPSHNNYIMRLYHQTQIFT